MTALLPARPTVRAGTRTAATRWRWVAAVFGAVAGGLHVAAAVDHRTAGELVVGFFLLVALTQLATGVWLAVGPGPRAGMPAWPVSAVLALTVGLLVLYLVAHTTDLLAGVAGDAHGGTGAGGHTGGAHAEPVGPIALDTEPVHAARPPGLLGTATVAVQLGSVLALTALLPVAFRRRAVNGLFALGVLAWLAWLTGVLA